MNDALGWLASIILLSGTFFVGKKHILGPLCGTIGSVLWAYRGVQIGEPALIVLNIAFIFLNGRNTYLWWKGDPDAIQ